MFKIFFKRRTRERRQNHLVYEGPERRSAERRTGSDRRHLHPFNLFKQKHDRRSGQERRAVASTE